jgi:hypothetical protein
MEVQAIVSTSRETDSITSSDITKRTLYFAYLANQSRLVTPNLNFPVLLNFPMQVPIEMRLGLAIDVAKCMVFTGR